MKPNELGHWPVIVVLLFDDRNPRIHINWVKGIPSVTHPADWELFEEKDALKLLPAILERTRPGYWIFRGTLKAYSDPTPEMHLPVCDEYFWHMEWHGTWRRPRNGDDLKLCAEARKEWT